MADSRSPRASITRLLIGGLFIALLAIVLLFFGARGALAKLGIDDLLPPDGEPLVATIMYPQTNQPVAAGEALTVVVDAVGAFPLERVTVEIIGGASETAAVNSETAPRVGLTFDAAPGTPGRYPVVATVEDEPG